MKFKKNDLICFEAYGMKLCGKVIRVDGSTLLYRSPERQTFQAQISEVTLMPAELAREMADIFAGI